jgi:hypothetical protein
MAQFDVYRHPVEEWRDLTPYVVDVQSSWVGGSELRLTVPLLRKTLDATDNRLYPQFQIKGETLVFDTLSIVSYPAQDLRSPIASLRAEAGAVFSAIDFVLHGY